jgi:hypothetical protein
VDDVASSYYNTLINRIQQSMISTALNTCGEKIACTNMAFGFYTTAILLQMAMAPVFSCTYGIMKIRHFRLHAMAKENMLNLFIGLMKRKPGFVAGG